MNDLGALRTEFRMIFEGMGEIPACTCDSCPERLVCEYAYDTYNTNGECVAEK